MGKSETNANALIIEPIQYFYVMALRPVKMNKKYICYPLCVCVYAYVCVCLLV